MNQTTIKIIYDNCKENHHLQEDWGFSALIETGHRKLLFDTGNNRNIFFSNLEKMDIRLDEITDVIFSHKHSDHITGCKEILGKLQRNSRVFLPKGFPLKEVPRQYLQIQKVSDFIEIDTNIYSMPLKGGFLWQEQSLILDTVKGLVIMTGCAHPGIVNIIKTSKAKLNKSIYLVLGGFHLFRENNQFIDDVVSEVQSLKVEKVAPCHCSGQYAIQKFQNVYCNNFYKVGAGTILTI